MTSTNRSIVLAAALSITAAVLPASAATLDQTEAPRVTHAAAHAGMSATVDDVQAPRGQDAERPRGEEAERPRGPVTK